MTFSPKNKKRNIDLIVKQMFARTLTMFKYTGLPDSIPEIELEKLLQNGGYAFITEHDGKLYAFHGGLGGTPDVYGNPTEIVVSNPALKLTKSFNLENDGVFIGSDSSLVGLRPVFIKYATLLAENMLTIDINSFNTRLTKVISASDSKTKESAELYLKKLQDGEPAVIGENALFEGIRVQGGESGQAGNITGLIELQQYLKAALFEEIGLDVPFNMKRERLNTSEVEQGESALYAFVDSMLESRKKGIEKLNANYGLKITVDFNGVWKHEKRVEESSIIID